MNVYRMTRNILLETGRRRKWKCANCGANRGKRNPVKAGWAIYGGNLILCPKCRPQ